MRYAVTGATGFVGGRLAAMLRDDGHDVVALVRRPERAQELRERGVELVPGDLENAAALGRLLDGADGLFHVAGWYKIGVRDPAEGRRVNVDGTRSVLLAARTAGTPRVVDTSTLAVNSDTHGAVRDETYHFAGAHLSAYDATKAEAHRIAEDFARAGLPVVTVMPGLVYGPGDTSQTGALLADLVRRRPVVVPSGGRLCWAHVDDVARGHVLAMQRGTPGEAYMLAGPSAGLVEGLRLGAELAGVRGPIVVPGAAVRTTAHVSAALGRVLPLPSLLAAESLRASTASYLGSPAKAQRDLGWSARPLREGLAQTVAALRASQSH